MRHHNSVAIVTIQAVALFLAGHAAAQLRPEPQSGFRSAAEVRASESTTASIQAAGAGDRQHALSFAQEAIRADADDPWGYYTRGSAQLALRQVNDAINSYHAAEQRSPDSDPWGRSVAIWGQANALSEAIRCQEASPIYERYAAFVQKLDQAAATRARDYAKKQCAPSSGPSYSAIEIDSINTEISGNHERALELAQAAVRANPDDGWAYYLQADALVSLHRVDEAVAAFRQAEQHFAASATWEKSIAIWGQANALKDAGRCTESGPIYARYASFVEARDPDGAAMGRDYAQRTCVPLRTGH